MSFRWVYAQPEPEKYVSEIKQALGVPDIIANLLAIRGIKTYDDAKSFFRPTIDLLYNPFLMKDMDLAVRRIEEAISKDESILIYGDYDVDGTTSVSLLYSYLSTLTPKIATYIPDRYDEGYGVSLKGIDFAEDNGFSLVVALDCGIKALNQVAYAKEKNIDFIICYMKFSFCRNK